METKEEATDSTRTRFIEHVASEGKISKQRALAALSCCNKAKCSEYEV